MLPDTLYDGGRLALNIGPLRGSAAVMLISWALAPASSRVCMHFCILFSRVQVLRDDTVGTDQALHELVNLAF